MMSAESEVEGAAVALIDAFAQNDRPRYFAAFVPEATFVFPTANRVLTSRADYEAEWQRWVENDDFKVMACKSFDRAVQVYDDFAILVHRTITESSSTAGNLTLHERETIVFRKLDGVWLAVHEHVSPLVE